ncbi:MAG: MarR family winged helix-turn-helix transcriptional regulator [Erysipelotrichaceae bacterium]|nr:MarR family winged helix-turn-helix transcriptional regulator [Erysipelotrichaceae bacterium]MDD3810397.1 MarR family winged helix-turn-helix transcriptional regulator [Erysipelotrichaceae bacterium]
MGNKDKLIVAFAHLMELQGSCSYETMSTLNIADLTIKQIEYITMMDKIECLTTSSLARELNLSKPTVTEMVKKFIYLDCVYKVQCSKDKRVSYIRLTPKGKTIANIERVKMEKLIELMIGSLEEADIETLVRILNKI